MTPCPIAARLRLRWYSLAFTISSDPTPEELAERDADPQYREAFAAYREHLTTCPACSVWLAGLEQASAKEMI